MPREDEAKEACQGSGSAGAIVSPSDLPGTRSLPSVRAFCSCSDLPADFSKADPERGQTMFGVYARCARLLSSEMLLVYLRCFALLIPPCFEAA
jgi:hypothetical protein